MSISKQITDPSTGKIKRLNNYPHVKAFRAKKKQILVDLLGGECCVCRYSKCLKSLIFHHVDPTKKSFGIASGGNDKALVKAREEIEKCILLCANCHGEVHDGILDISHIPVGTSGRSRTLISR